LFFAIWFHTVRDIFIKHVTSYTARGLSPRAVLFRQNVEQAQVLTKGGEKNVMGSFLGLSLALYIWSWFLD
jgi:hypothetical protein